MQLHNLVVKRLIREHCQFIVHFNLQLREQLELEINKKNLPGYLDQSETYDIS